jgi:hypothetical protein
MLHVDIGSLLLLLQLHQTHALMLANCTPPILLAKITPVAIAILPLSFNLKNRFIWTCEESGGEGSKMGPTWFQEGDVIPAPIVLSPLSLNSKDWCFVPALPLLCFCFVFCFVFDVAFALLLLCLCLPNGGAPLG